MRLDFNQKGSWRKGPEFDERDMALVREAGERLADLSGANLRIIGEVGEVVSYRDPHEGWRENKTRGQS